MFKHIEIFVIIWIGVASYKVSDFKPGIFSTSPPFGFHSVNTGDDIDGELLIFTDVNADLW